MCLTQRALHTAQIAQKKKLNMEQLSGSELNSPKGGSCALLMIAKAWYFRCMAGNRVNRIGKAAVRVLLCRREHNLKSGSPKEYKKLILGILSAILTVRAR